MAPLTLTLPLIRAAAADAGDRYMRAHPEEQPNGSQVWTHNAFHAAAAEFNRLCRAAGLTPHALPPSARRP